MSWRPYISKRAMPAADGVLHLLPAIGAPLTEHWLTFPRAACPVSGNPIGGLVRVQYQPATSVIEIVSLRDLVRSSPLKANSIEGVAAWLHATISAAVDVPVAVDLWLLVRPGPQIYRVRHG